MVNCFGMVTVFGKSTGCGYGYRVEEMCTG